MAPPISGMKLTFADEFNSLSLGSQWKPHDHWGNRTLPRNKELQIYVDPAYKGLGINPFSINNGVLTIKAAKAGGNASKLGKNYTSGMLSSHGPGGFSQQYGYFEMRAQLPAGKGMWPGFWLLSNNGTWPPELDVMESIGSLPNYVVQSIHSKDGNKGKPTYTSANLQQGFHTYGMNWTKETVSYYVDGKKTVEFKTPSDMHTKMHMLMQVAVGGTWPGSPDATTDWSKTNLKVDYVRVYSANPSATPVASAPTPTNPAPATSAPPNSGSASTAGGTGDVILSNKMSTTDLSDHFKAGGGKNTTKTYTAGQMAIGGVLAPTTVTVATNNDRDITVTNNGAWSAIRTATIKTPGVGDVTVRNFVAADIALGGSNVARAVNVSGVKRGTIALGSGNDTVTVSGRSNSFDSNLLTINTGGGNDRVSYTGENDNRVRIDGGSGADTITISGKAAATVNAGSENDRINTHTTGKSTVSGGTGRDVFSFIAGAHATITDFKSADDRIELKGIGGGNVRVRASGGSTFVDLGSSGRITVAGASLSQSALHISYA